MNGIPQLPTMEPRADTKQVRFPGVWRRASLGGALPHPLRPPAFDLQKCRNGEMRNSLLSEGDTHTHATLPRSTKRNLQPWIGRRRCGSLEDRCAEMRGLWQPQMLMLHHAALGLGRVLLHSSLIHMLGILAKTCPLAAGLQPNLAEFPLATAET